MGVTCAKLGEAEIMAAAGIHDILVANQIVGARKYTRLANLSRTVDVKIAVDSIATLAELNAAAEAHQSHIGLIIELNTGMNRAGVEPGAPTLALAKAIDAYPALDLRGLMSWEGHTLRFEDDGEKRAAISHAIGMLRDSADLCRQAGLPIEIVSCGGSGTFWITVDEAGISEIQAGGAVFNDMTYSGWKTPTTQALFVHAVVTSRPTPTRVITDAGFKTLPRWSGPPKALGMEGIETMSMSAEHGVITLREANDTIAVGDRYDFVPGYGDHTVFLHNHLYGMRNGVVEAVWEIAARGALR